ncbi:uncharacterized protein LOC5522393 [Nematostella vectensis]|uniref:uncharacterized protein LOC5522393 n=1 Tax=Nematostella vectensis TaxID=45351 RepID=UPI0020777C1B|nr:uncharacterized protein LOC5522393 [Nematostella vectensis]XP_048582885.1 uncharacterized protein LOC5522393 [Nematostella vectensis]
MALLIALWSCVSVLVHLGLCQGNIPSSDGGTGLSQIDLEAAKDVTICTTQKKPLSCSYPGSNIAITGVFWGRRSASICPSDDGDTELNCFTSPETQGIVKARCEGKESCELEARHAILQNPRTSHCPGVNKYLIVNYTCVPDAKEVVLCDSENSTLWCPAMWKIGVNSVFWGRQSTVVCPAENGQTTCTGAPESLGIVKKSCDGLGRCEVHASAEQVQNGAENCPGVTKYLIINYSCRPHANIGTEDDIEPPSQDRSEDDEQRPQQQAKAKESVAKALKQLDEGQKNEQPEPEATGADLNIGRLGMGGLKALEKINNLIKASAEAQGGEESVAENGLTDDQAQTIERMIIEGIKNIKKKNTEAGTRKTAIPRKITDSRAQIMKPRPSNNAPSNKGSKIAAVNADTPKSGVVKSLPNVVKNTGAAQGVVRTIPDANKAGVVVIPGSGSKARPVPVLRDTVAKEPIANKAKIRGLTIGNAGMGNMP